MEPSFWGGTYAVTFIDAMQLFSTTCAVTTAELILVSTDVVSYNMRLKNIYFFQDTWMQYSYHDY